MAKKEKVKEEDVLNLIKIEYVSDPKTSYRKLAEKYNYPFKKISEIGKKEGWGQLRVQLRDKIFKKTMNRISTKKSDEYSRVIQSANKILGVIEKNLDDPKQFNRYIVTENSESVEKIFKKADAKALKEMTGALKEIMAVISAVNSEKKEKNGEGTKKIQIEYRKMEAEEDNE